MGPAGEEGTSARDDDEEVGVEKDAGEAVTSSTASLFFFLGVDMA